MNMRTILPIMVVVLVFVSILREARAERATEAEMRLVCENWLAYMVYSQGDWAGNARPRIVGVQELTHRDTVLARCFSIAPRGHVVVPILKELPPVKVFSEESDLDVNQTVGFPQLLREVLLHRTRLFIRTYGSMDAKQPARGDVLFGRKHTEEWTRFSVSRERFDGALRRETFERWATLGPLLTTAWDQFEPYYNFCPFGDGDTCLVGCVATAAAQIMKYHEWPDAGVGSHTYWWDGDTSCGGSTPGCSLYADFSDSYDWANMPNNCWYGCSPTEDSALAELCYEVGVAFEMDYGACGSGAWTDDALTVFPTYFRYSQAIDREDRSDYGDAQDWFQVIRSEIYAGRPMQYRILAHSIVCDGCSDTGGALWYHINYGWEYGQFTGWWWIDLIPGSADPMVEYLIRNIIPLRGTVWVVDSAGTGDFATIQDAINSALVDSGDVIELLNGTFTGPGNRSIDYNGKAVTIRSRSGNPDSCIIDCEYSGERGFIFDSGEGDGSVLEGVMVKRGKADSDSGGGVYCGNGSSPTFIYCYITSCSAAVGGGVFCTNSSPRFTNCHIGSNWATSDDLGGGGVFCGDNGSPIFRNCSICNNLASYGAGVHSRHDCAPQFVDCGIGGNSASRFGGGLFSFESTPVFYECSFGSNGAVVAGGGVCEFNSSGTFNACIFSGGEAPVISAIGGAVASNGSSSNFTNCILMGNQAVSQGGGVYCQYTSSTFRNCTLYNNTLTGMMSSGGGIYCESSSAIFNSMIITESGAGGGIYLRGSATCAVDHCDISGNMGGDIIFFNNDPLQGPPGLGQLVTTNANDDSCDIYSNINLDPAFRDPLFGNLRLSPASPCIGAADPIAPPSHDIEGIPRPRPAGSNPDIGAHESWQGTPQEELCDYLSGTLGPGIYHVVCDIFVASGSSLRIMPGTTLLFDSTCSFTIFGTLLAEGNPDSAIMFTSDTSLNANHWHGMQFLDTTSSGSQLAYCLIEKGLATGEFPEHCGGGVRCSTSAPTFTCCTFRDNSATGSGGAVHCGYYRSPTFTNCVFSGNRTDMSGGGVYCVYCSSIFTNCTFTGNSAASSGGGATCAQGSPGFFNTIIAFCDGQGIYFANTWSTHVEHCDFFGNTGGAFGGNSIPGGAGVLTTTNANGDSCDIHRNIFLDPMFADTAELDFHLTDYSPCLGAADPANAPPVDRDGNPRPNPAGSNPDIGAFEYWLAGSIRQLVISFSGDNAVLNWPPFATTYSIYGSADIDSQGDSLDTVTGVTTWTDMNTASRPSPYFYYVTAESPEFRGAGKTK